MIQLFLFIGLAFQAQQQDPRLAPPPEKSDPETLEFLREHVDQTMYHIGHFGIQTAQMNTQLKTGFGDVDIRFSWYANPWRYEVDLDLSKVTPQVRPRLKDLLENQLDPQELSTMLLLPEAGRGKNDFIVRHVPDGGEVRVDYFIRLKDHDSPLLKRSNWYTPKGRRTKTASYGPPSDGEILIQVTNFRTEPKANGLLVVRDVENAMGSSHFEYGEHQGVLFVKAMHGQGPQGEILVTYDVAYSKEDSSKTEKASDASNGSP